MEKIISLCYNDAAREGCPVKNEMRRVAVVGGGAGGLAAAIAAAGEGCTVAIYEMRSRVGKKLLQTGNGRCNLTNRHITPADYNHPEFVAPVLNTWSTERLLDFFAELGLWTVSDGEGRIYPRSDTASSVLDVLRLRCAALGVEEHCASEVVSLSRSGSGWQLSFREGEDAFADAVIIATGGETALLKPLGHELKPFAPILCPLKTDTAPIRGLTGLRVRCTVTLSRRGKILASEAGEVLFRDFGVSGIVILNMSRFAQKGDTLTLDLLPELTEAELSGRLRSHTLRGEEIFTGIFHRRVGEALLRNTLSRSPEALSRAAKNLGLTVQGAADEKSAQVTRGGAAVSGFDPATLASRACPGLYCIGEALDVDGRCGGFNLHWAFSSGLTAGRGAAHG